MEITELKWTIYFVNCYPKTNRVFDEALETTNEPIKISESIKDEIEKWKEW